MHDPPNNSINAGCDIEEKYPPSDKKRPLRIIEESQITKAISENGRKAVRVTERWSIKASNKRGHERKKKKQEQKRKAETDLNRNTVHSNQQLK